MNVPSPSGVAPRVFSLRDDCGLQLDLLDRGATWWRLRLPVPGEPKPRDLIVGGADPQAHLANTSYLGATIGRFANRIAHARIERGGRHWALTTAPGERHQLHGGPQGFHTRDWRPLQHTDTQLTLALAVPDGDQGYPGALEAEIDIRLPGQRVIEIELRARASAPTPVSLTQHAYFNLDGRATDARAHRLQLQAARVLPVDDELIPCGPPGDVADTPFDFRTLRPISEGGRDGFYDHAYLLDEPGAGLRHAARLQSGDGRVGLELETDLPSLQLYSGACLSAERGYDGQALPAYAGIALEPQYLPDSPHHPEWPQPSCWLEPGQLWRHRIRYVFALESPAR